MGSNGNGKKNGNGKGKNGKARYIAVPVPKEATASIDNHVSVYDEKAPEVWRLVYLGGMGKTKAFDILWPEKSTLTQASKVQAIQRALRNFSEKHGAALREVMEQADLGFEQLARQITRLLNAKKRVVVGRKTFYYEDMTAVAKGVELQMRALGIGLAFQPTGPLMTITNNVLILPAKEAKGEWQKHLEQLKAE